MENKYYTPDITDIRVGYECEGLTYIVGEYATDEQIREMMRSKNGEWVPITFETFHFSSRANGELRTPYLTKEQIKAEGWVDQKDRGMSENSGILAKKGNATLQYWFIHPRLSVTNYAKGTLYDGPCTSINEFRYICKLLGI